MSMPARTKTPEFAEALDIARSNPAAPQPACIDSVMHTSDSQAELEEAAAECVRECPLLEVCRASALHVRPAWGAQGGIVWINGRQLHLRRKKEEMPLDLVS